MENVIKLATDKKYTEFADAVKAELQNKLNSNEVMASYNAEIEKISNYKSAFQGINNSEE